MNTNEFDSLRNYVRELRTLGYDSAQRRELISNNSSDSLDRLISDSRTSGQEFKLAGSSFVGAAAFGIIAWITPLDPQLSHLPESSGYIAHALSAVGAVGAFYGLSISVTHFYRGIKKLGRKKP